MTANPADQEGAAADPLAALLAATATGDRAAFRSLYDMAAPGLLGIAIRILRSREPAEEALQEAFLAIWQRAGQFSPAKGAAYPWLAMLVRHRAIDKLRAGKRHVSSGSIDDVVDMDPERLASPWAPQPFARPDGDGRDLRICLSRLNENSRRAIALAFYEGLTHEELAERMGAPLGTVKTWVRRGLQALKECLES
ncbi:MAG: sigma-70 family RNA polymerase sigma factor [Alphaproteobacteria bacterium]|nr:sigma-70 family RNA polymerase sigma factor [Alphaproteobacteria bacterium]